MVASPTTKGGVAMSVDQATQHEVDIRQAKEKLDRTLTEGEVPSCALDEQGIKEQQARHARLAPSVIGLDHQDEAVLFTFAEDFDRTSLNEMVAVEEQCCPFFRFAFDED